MGRGRLTVITRVVLLGSSAAQAAGTPRFAFSATTVTAAELRTSYRPGCPVPPAELRLLDLSYWGFDGRAHRGRLVVNEAVVPADRHVFATRFARRFPIGRMEPFDRLQGNDYRSMAPTTPRDRRGLPEGR